MTLDELPIPGLPEDATIDEKIRYLEHLIAQKRESDAALKRRAQMEQAEAYLRRRHWQPSDRGEWEDVDRMFSVDARNRLGV